jgi:hypothetical protein
VIGGAHPTLNASGVRSPQGLCRVRKLCVTEARPLTQCVAWAPFIMTSTIPRVREQAEGIGRHYLYSPYTRLSRNLRCSLFPHTNKTGQRKRPDGEEIDPLALPSGLFVSLGPLI